MSVTWICREKSFWSQNSVSGFSKAQWSTRLLERFGAQILTEGLMQGSFKYSE